MEKKIIFLYILIFLIIISTDQISKWFILHSNFNYSINTGISFSFLTGMNTLSFFVSAFITLGLFAVFFVIKKYQLRIIIISIIAASCSNLLDRILHGGVIDFINLPIIPTFNLADLVISSGIILLISLLLFFDGKEEIRNK